MKKIFFPIVALFILLTVQLDAYSQDYSLVDDWSDSSNPNGVWSYNEGDTPLPYNLANWPLGAFGPTQTAWTKGNVNPQETYLPGWFKSVVDPNSFGYAETHDWVVGDVVVHTSRNSPPANVTWTSPITGPYDIEGGLWAGKDIGRSNDWNLYLDGSLLANGRVYSGDEFSRSNPETFSLKGLDIDAGSILMLEVVRTTNQEDFVGVNMDITLVPEPVSMILFLVGGAPIAASLYRKKRKLG